MKYLLSLLLSFSLLSSSYAAVAVGTNSGFIEQGSEPGGDPSGTNRGIDAYAVAQEDTAPAGSPTVVQIMWWCAYHTDGGATWDAGLYDDDGGAPNLPDALLGSTTTHAVGAGGAWKDNGSCSWAMTGGQIHWPAVRVNNTTGTGTDRNSSGQSAYDIRTVDFANPWGDNDVWAYDLAICGIYTTGATPARRIMIISKEYNPAFGVNVLGNELSTM